MEIKNLNTKDPVKLRSKSIKNGNLSLYLDIYYKGQRKYEFLRIYLIPERNKADRMYNHRCLQLAHAIRNRRLVELQASFYSDRQPVCKHSSNFLDYIDLFMKERKKAYRSLCRGLKNHLIRYKGPVIPFDTIDKSFLTGFHRYLKTASVCGNVAKYQSRLLSQGTRWNYFNILSLLLNKAYREGFWEHNPLRELCSEDRPRRAEPIKTYLVMDEVRKLAHTPLERRNVKQAFLFSCLCGLRFSDVKRLQWYNLQTDSCGHTLAEIVQQKTGSLLYLPISAEAMKQLPPSESREGLVFKHLPDASLTGKILKEWVRRAGIRKRVTFHTARHTFATLSLTYGAELYTISKLLGHSSIKVTQIYADIISEKKREAVDAIPPIK